MPTEREAVARERAAWMAGYDHPMRWVGDYSGTWTPSGHVRLKYPYPKVTRPRVVRDPEFDQLTWSVSSDGVPSANGSHPGPALRAYYPIPARVALWADLLARPTEEVEEEGP